MVFKVLHKAQSPGPGFPHVQAYMSLPKANEDTKETGTRRQIKCQGH